MSFYRSYITLMATTWAFRRTNQVSYLN